MEKAQINEFIEQHKQEAVALLEELGMKSGLMKHKMLSANLTAISMRTSLY